MRSSLAHVLYCVSLLCITTSNNQQVNSLRHEALEMNNSCSCAAGQRTMLCLHKQFRMDVSECLQPASLDWPKTQELKFRHNLPFYMWPTLCTRPFCVHNSQQPCCWWCLLYEMMPTESVNELPLCIIIWHFKVWNPPYHVAVEAVAALGKCLSWLHVLAKWDRDEGREG